MVCLVDLWSKFLFGLFLPFYIFSCKQLRRCRAHSYSDQSLEVDEIFPKIIRDDDEYDEDEDDDNEISARGLAELHSSGGGDKTVERDTMELDFNELTFN